VIERPRWVVTEAGGRGRVWGERTYRVYQSFPVEASRLWEALLAAIPQVRGARLTARDDPRRSVEVMIAPDLTTWLLGWPLARHLAVRVSEEAPGRAALTAAIRLRFVGLAGPLLVASQGVAEQLWAGLADAVERQLLPSEGPGERAPGRSCGSCGSPLPAEARFCGFCGAAVPGAPASDGPRSGV
jgi:hypothetical protein